MWVWSRQGSGASYAVVSKAAPAPVTKVTIKELPAAAGNHPGQPANAGQGPGLYRAPLTPPQPEKVQAVVKHLATTAAPVAPTPHVTKTEISEVGKRPVADVYSPQPVRSPEPVKALQNKHQTPPPTAPRPGEVHSRSNSSPAVVPVPRTELQLPARHETSPVQPSSRPPNPTAGGKPSKTDP